MLLSAPKALIAAPRSAKQKTDSRPVLATKLLTPAHNITADLTQVPTSEPPRTTFAESARAVNSTSETPALLPSGSDFTGLQQQITLFTKQMLAATQRIPTMQNSLFTLVDTCTRAVIGRLAMQGIIPFGGPPLSPRKHG